MLKGRCSCAIDERAISDQRSGGKKKADRAPAFSGSPLVTIFNYSRLSASTGVAYRPLNQAEARPTEKQLSGMAQGLYSVGLPGAKTDVVDKLPPAAG